MKITDLRTFIVGNPWKNWLFVRLETDEGLTGLGEGTLGLSTLPVEAALQELKRFILGKDPLQIHRLVNHISEGWYVPDDPVHVTAISSVEIACWDLLGKKTNTPIYQLLGGASRDRIPVYANGWYRCPRQSEAFAARAKEVVDQGYRGLKFDPFGEARGSIATAEERLSLEIVSAVRAAVGPDVQIMIEAHDRFDVPTAIRLGRLLEPHQVTWLEAPVPSTDIEALHSVAAEIPIPIAAGERFSRPGDFIRLGASRRIAYWQPETLSIGGVSGLVRVSSIAQALGATIAPHNARGPVCTAVNAHLAAWLPNLYILEQFEETSTPLAFEVIKNTPRVKDGWLELPQGPGLGIELDEEAARRFPYRPDNFMQFFQAGWEKRFDNQEGG
jgi:galactonate dehydratase